MIDLRSDTVTRPTPEMLQAMMRAEVGDDVCGEDPSVNALQTFLAEQVGMEAGLFVSSGTQSNLLALMSHCERGDEYIAGQDAHLYKWEGGGAAVLGSIQPQPIEFEKDGSLNLDAVKKKIKPVDPHYARTRLLCLENTQAGRVLSLDYLEQACQFADENQLKIHLDGARAHNAAVKLGVPIRKVVSGFDSVSICLSKSLGAPVGSVLCGSEELISKARRWRKVLGGGMRQAGILAAGGLYALRNHVDRLAEDHARAEFLARELARIDELEVDLASVQTNMVFASVKKGSPEALAQYLRERGIVIRPGASLRLVTHLDVSETGIRRVAEAFQSFFLAKNFQTSGSSYSGLQY